MVTPKNSKTRLEPKNLFGGLKVLASTEDSPAEADRIESSI